MQRCKWIISPKIDFVSYKIQYCLEVTKCNTSSHCSFWTWSSFYLWRAMPVFTLLLAWLLYFSFRQNCFPLSFRFIYLFILEFFSDWRSFHFLYVVFFFFFCAVTVAVLIMLTTQPVWSHPISVCCCCLSTHETHHTLLGSRLHSWKELLHTVFRPVNVEAFMNWAQSVFSPEHLELPHACQQQLMRQDSCQSKFPVSP